jgi:hypothetical protein
VVASSARVGCTASPDVWSAASDEAGALLALGVASAGSVREVGAATFALDRSSV